MDDWEDDKGMASWEAERARVREELRQGSHSQYSGGAALGTPARDSAGGSGSRRHSGAGSSRRASQEDPVDGVGAGSACAPMAAAGVPSGHVGSGPDGDGLALLAERHGGGGADGAGGQEEDWQKVEREAAAE